MKLLEKLKYISISLRISILLGIIILLTMGVFSTFSLIKQKQDSIDSIIDNSDLLSKTIEKILRVSMLKNRREDISVAVKNIIGKEGIKSVRILNHKGEVKFSSLRLEKKNHVLQNERPCLSCHNVNGNKPKKNVKQFNRYRIEEEKNLIYNYLPIYNAPSCYNEVCHSATTGYASFGNNISQTNLASFSAHDSSHTILGFIEIDVSTKRVIANLASTRNQLIVFTIIFALIASIITYFSIQRLVGKPVKHLVKGTMRVARGNFMNEIPPGKAELKLLAESFNKMQKQLLVSQTQLIESEKLASVGKLADEIANQVNNPLTGIIVYSESLIEELSSDESKKNDCEVIRIEALKIRENIRNILSLTRHDKPAFKSADLGQIIKHATSIVKEFSNFRNIQIVLAIPKTLPSVFADAGLLKQVFLNLLLISSESIPAGGLLNISAVYSEDEKEIEINFSDTGKGIQESILKKVLDPISSTDLENFGKTGISLAVCKEIIEMHKGKISVKSEIGIGTTIIINLPI